MPRSERRANLYAAVFGVLLAGGLLLLGEAAARWRISRIPAASVPSGLDHPPYYNNPGVTISPRALGFHVDYRINAGGMRGPETTLEKKGPRILILGDSLVFGAFAREEETLSAQLERRLRKSTGRPWEVLNGGVSSYDAWDYEGFLRLKGLAYKPDIVVVGLFMNDHIQRKIFVETTRAKAAPRRRLLATVRDLVFKSELVNAAMYWMQRKQDPKRPWVAVAKPLRPEDREFLAKTFPGDLQTQAAAEKFLTDYKFDPGLLRDALPWLLDLKAWRETAVPLRRMRALCDKNGAKLLVLVFPLQFEAYPGYRWPEPHASIASLLKAQGIGFVDLLDVYRRSGGDALYPMRYDTFHPSALGYSLAAESLEAALAKRGWLDGR
jgi:lysophospholipase L1-like esterase